MENVQMNLWTVYVHISPNNKTYVGITSQKITHRWRNKCKGLEWELITFGA